MGKKRLKIIDLSQEKTEPSKTAPSKKEKPGRKIVKTGKQHGRLADMGAIMLEEMEKRQKEKPEKVIVKQKKQLKKPPRPPKKRSKRYQKIKKHIKPNQLYPLSEAIKLLKKTANAQFEETVELHLTVTKPGKITKEIKTETKAPLVHLKIGKISQSEKILEKEIKEILRSVGLMKIKKAVLTSTMGPGIKIALSEKTA